jgi:hypothetical protein
MGWILSPIVHSLMFCQIIEGNLRTACVELMGNVVVPPPDNMGGNWVLNRADSDSVVAVVLYRDVTGSDRKRLIWRYDATQHGELIEIGINTPSEDNEKGKYMTFSKWFSLHDAKLLAVRRVSRPVRVIPGRGCTRVVRAWREFRHTQARERDMECATVQSSNACDDGVSGRRNGVHPVRSLFHKTIRITWPSPAPHP